MTLLQHSKYLYLAISLSIFVLNCGSGNQAATEVENEITLAKINGTAATGAAIADGKIELLNTALATIAHTYSDSQGNYTIHAEYNADTNTPFAVRVVYGTNSLDTLFSLIPYPEHSDTVVSHLNRRIHINPLTNHLAMRLRNMHSQSARQPISQADWEAGGEQLLQDLFGDNIPWATFANDSAFRAWVPGGQQKPSPSDALLHALGDQLRAKNISLDSLWRQQQNNPTPLLQDSSFNDIFMTKLLIMNVDSLEVQTELRQWMPNNPQTNLILNRYQQIRQGKNDSTAPAPNLEAQVFRMLENTLANAPIPDSLAPFVPQMADIARQVLIHSLQPMQLYAWSPQIEQNSKPFLEEIVHTTVRTLLQYTPQEYRLETASIHINTMQFIQENVNAQIDLDILIADDSGQYFQNNFTPVSPEMISGSRDNKNPDNSLNPLNQMNQPN
jgi:hypothetical protein